MSNDFGKSLNTSDQSEPPVFALVKLRIAEKHYDLFSGPYDSEECEMMANRLPFLLEINRRLRVVNIECKIRLSDKRTWAYSFEFFDQKRNKVLDDINSLSAGQKSIVHLVFEAYGRGDLKGGVVIIDEPEIHLHYQFQNEYLNIIRTLNKTQKCQYILVTHSEALIDSTTINQVRRFALNDLGNSEVKSPILSTQQKNLIKILDNTRSTYAFFAKKVLLVEGETDRYFFKAMIAHSHPSSTQEIAVLDIGGKGQHDEWRNLFENFGLSVYFVADFDFVVDKFYPDPKAKKITDQDMVLAFKKSHPDWEKNIESLYTNQIYILKNGDLEHYLGIEKKLPSMIRFCDKNLTSEVSRQNWT